MIDHLSAICIFLCVRGLSEEFVFRNIFINNYYLKQKLKILIFVVLELFIIKRIFKCLFRIFYKFHQSTLHQPPINIYLRKCSCLQKQYTRLACSMCLSRNLMADDSVPLNLNKPENFQFHFQGQVRFD